MRRLYHAYAAGAFLLYSVATWNGWELWPARRGVIPADVRQSPGGYRSYTYWRGGK